MHNGSLITSFRNAASGIATAIRSERNFRIHCIAATAVVVLLAFTDASPLWWAVMLLTIGSVLSVELLNTALEHLIDHIHPEIHPAIKTAKDCASGATLVLSILSVGILAAYLVTIF